MSWFLNFTFQFMIPYMKKDLNHNLVLFNLMIKSNMANPSLGIGLEISIVTLFLLLLLGYKTLGTKCIRTSLCIMLANHDQNIEFRFRLAQSVFICKSWNWVIAGFIGLNLQGSIDRKLGSINRTSGRLIFLQNFPTQPKPSLTCRVLCFTSSIKRKTITMF